MQVITLNHKEFLKKLEELCEQIDMVPDVIIEVLNAGGYLGVAIKSSNRFKNVHFKRVKLQRIGESIKSSLIFRIILKILPYSVLDKLRIYESNKSKRTLDTANINELSKLEIDLNDLHFPKETKIQKILIVDDAIDTGRTMFIVKNNVQKLFPEADINVAVMSWTLKKSLVTPNYYIFKNSLVRFPWSKDYKGKDFDKKSFSI